MTGLPAERHAQVLDVRAACRTRVAAPVGVAGRAGARDYICVHVRAYTLPVHVPSRAVDWSVVHAVHLINILIIINRSRRRCATARRFSEFDSASCGAHSRLLCTNTVNCTRRVSLIRCTTSALL